MSNPTLHCWDDSRHLGLNTATPTFPVKAQSRPADSHHLVHALTRFNKQTNKQTTPSIGQKAPPCLNEMAKPSGAACRNIAWPSLFDMCRAVFPTSVQNSALFWCWLRCALSAFHLLLTIRIFFCISWFLFVFFFLFFLKEIMKVYSMIFRVCDWRLLFNKQSVNWSVLWGAVGLPGQLHSKSRAAPCVQHSEGRGKPSCSSTKLLHAVAGRHQHEESISLWRSFLSSFGLTWPLASRSAKTKQKVNF